MATVFVTLCDPGYWFQALVTLTELRVFGAWAGDVVLIAVDFEPAPLILANLRVQVVRFPRLDLAAYLARLRACPFSEPTNDGREVTNLAQWEKLYAFEPFFWAWDRLVWLDAGLRVFRPVAAALEVPWAGRFVAPVDSCGPFARAVEQVHWPAERAALAPIVDMAAPFFLNCLWIYDTRLRVPLGDFTALLTAPLWRHNEMGVMNVVLSFARRVWAPLEAPDVFDWSEVEGRRAADYCFVKYSRERPLGWAWWGATSAVWDGAAWVAWVASS